ncbi:hypothetical protein WS75_10185 [Burkholderia sp. FL-7-2-10-S1-D7]|nr:hypothetical protein WS75_10185 [Burkholderia sp. FL-7-2-10-S1-D7]
MCAIHCIKPLHTVKDKEIADIFNYKFLCLGFGSWFDGIFVYNGECNGRHNAAAHYVLCQSFVKSRILNFALNIKPPDQGDKVF